MYVITGASGNTGNEFVQSLNDGKIVKAERTQESTTATTIEEFANTFNYVYNMN